MLKGIVLKTVNCLLVIRALGLRSYIKYKLGIAVDGVDYWEIPKKN